MKRLQTILCATLLTLSISSIALAGNISGAPSPDGNISGRAGNISGRDGGGNISGAPSTIGDILSGIICDFLIP